MTTALYYCCLLLFVCLFVCLLACLLACFLAFLLACLLACLLFCLFVCCCCRSYYCYCFYYGFSFPVHCWFLTAVGPILLTLSIVASAAFIYVVVVPAACHDFLTAHIYICTSHVVVVVGCYCRFCVGIQRQQHMKLPTPRQHVTN